MSNTDRCVPDWTYPYSPPFPTPSYPPVYPPSYPTTGSTVALYPDIEAELKQLLDGIDKVTEILDKILKILEGK